MVQIHLEKSTHFYQLEDRGKFPPWVVGQLLIRRDTGDVDLTLKLRITEDNARHLRDTCQELLDNLEEHQEDN